jgi:hypothetical protein
VAGSFSVKEQGFLQSLENFQGCLEWFGPNYNYFLETEGPAAIPPMSRDRGLDYNKLTGA